MSSLVSPRLICTVAAVALWIEMGLVGSAAQAGSDPFVFLAPWVVVSEVMAIGRFSDPPRPSDLADLTLDQRDLDAIRRCRPGNCALKLSAGDIESLTAALSTAGAEWPDTAQREFRRLLAERAVRYRAGGLAALAPAADGNQSRKPDEALSAIVEGRIGRQAPAIVGGLRARLESGNPPEEASDGFVNTRPGVR